MRQLVILLTVIVCYFSPQSLSAQDAFNRWSISLGTNAVNNPVRELPGEMGRFSNWNQDGAALKLSGSYYFGKGFSFVSSASVNNITETDESSNEEFAYVSVDGAIKYNLTKGFVFNPYLKAGGGYTWLQEIGAGTINGGGGFNIWFTNNFGINVESIYKFSFEDNGLQHWQHSAGIVFKFGANDRDKDGIKDEDDQCPDEFGLLEFNGCPDTDGDGVKDSEDACPNIAGLATLNGCPDTDGDGVPDKSDACPDVSGPIELNGCPDGDGDGIPDAFDRCPEQPGPNNNGGCPIPDTDGDGLDDSVDRCPQQPGPASNGGCPVVQQQAYKKTVFFEYATETLTIENQQLLDIVAQEINAQPNKIFHIAGHADNTFDEDLNLRLSMDRATTVKNYLVQRGVDEARLTVKGYGETRPLDPNDTESEEARAKNRRVEIIELK